MKYFIASLCLLMSFSSVSSATSMNMSENDDYTTNIAVSKESLILTPYGGWRELTVTNNSLHTVAINIAADLNDALVSAGISQYSGNCASLMAGKSCTLAFIVYYSGVNKIEETQVPIHGDNTNVVNAKIALLQPSLGEDFEGGKVACLTSLANRNKILISARQDNSPEYGIQWGGFYNGGEAGAFSDDDGKANTAAITSKYGDKTCVDSANCYNYAAKLCSDYEVDYQGNTPCKTGSVCYKDWYLPAKNELNCLWQNKTEIGGFKHLEDGGTCYWSSTELPKNKGEWSSRKAWWQDFLEGRQMAVWKHSVPGVRCVRQVTL